MRLHHLLQVGLKLGKFFFVLKHDVARLLVIAVVQNLATSLLLLDLLGDVENFLAHLGHLDLPTIGTLAEHIDCFKDLSL